MNKQFFCGFLFLGLLSVVTTEAMGYSNIRGRIMPQNAPVATLPSVQNLNLESPFRCDVADFGDVEVMTTLSLSPSDFTLRQVDMQDPLPRYEVNGFSFETMPIDEALQRLVKEADITVYTQDRVYPELNASDLYGELEPVVAELTRAGDVFYRYDEGAKRLTISKRGQFELQLPDNRAVVFAVLDALRGAGIKNIVPNWKDFSVMLTLNRAEEETVNRLMSGILKDGKLLVADTQVYALSPVGVSDWQQVINRFGPGRVYTAKNGMAGKILSMGHKNKAEDLLVSLRPNYRPTLISEGMAIVPHGWKMRFDVGRCALKSDGVSSLSVVLNAQIKNPQEVETTISLNTADGQVSTFGVWTAVDEELAIIGLPASVSGLKTNAELLITLKLRFIRLLSEGK